MKLKTFYNKTEAGSWSKKYILKFQKNKLIGPLGPVINIHKRKRIEQLGKDAQVFERASQWEGLVMCVFYSVFFLNFIL